jgi:hypothetical protein
MKLRLKRSIGLKMAVAMTIGLFLVISFFSHTTVRLSEKRLLSMAEKESAKMSKAIKSSLENAMLNNETEDGVQNIITALSQESMVYDIKIIDLDGQVKQAKNSEEIGVVLDRSEKSCAFCHTGPKVLADNLSVLFTLDNGTRILRNVNPIANGQSCHDCHDPQQQILGKLLIDFTTADIEQVVRDNRILLILSAVATLCTSVVMCFLLSTVLVKRPLSRLLVKMHCAGGDKERESAVSGEDEVAILNDTYDTLMLTIEERNAKIKEQMDELLALYNVSQILNKSDSIDDNVDLILKALHIGFQVEKCAILLLEGASSFRLKGCSAQDKAKAEALTVYLAEPAQLDRIMGGETFVARGSGEFKDDFLVVPLQAANTIIGVLAVCSVAGKEITSEDLKRSFGVIATSLAPHFQIGLNQSEKKEMQISPYNSFLAALDGEIAKVQEYMGSLSLALIHITNYDELCSSRRAGQASQLVQEISVQFSANLRAVHTCTRLAEDVIAVILPMLDGFEAPDTVNGATTLLDADVSLAVKIATYPDNGQNGLELLHALRT